MISLISGWIEADPATLIFLCCAGLPTLGFILLLWASGQRRQRGDASHLANSQPPLLGISETK